MIACGSNFMLTAVTLTLTKHALSSTLAIWPPGRAHRSTVAWLPQDFFGSVGTGNPQKVSLRPRIAYPLRQTVSAPRRACGQGYGLQEPQRSPFGTLLEAHSVPKGRCIDGSSCPLWEDRRGTYPTLFPNKWLKSSLEEVKKIEARPCRRCSNRGMTKARGR